MRLFCRSPKAGPGQETLAERDRWINTPCRVKLDIYLVGDGREEREEKRRRGERETQRQTEGGRGEWERLRLQAGRKICLPQWMGEGVGRDCLLMTLWV